MNGTAGENDLIRVVLADANVLYSRVLRDYLLYAADQEIITIAWSAQILAEVTEHLMANVEGFDQAAARRLVAAMNHAFPYAEVEPDEEHWRTLNDMSLPDEDDRHVLAASLAAEATVLCTSNVKDFPAHLVEVLGFEVLTPDQLLSRLVVDYEPQMLAVHRTAVDSLKGATDESTVAALRRAGASTAAGMIKRLLE
ncbi:PIN domain-containing protein [Micromonospora sp. NBC_01813]|uniref:PIN domain-containing protein n=1 Tax=Micromonospora sp. NBC_01813 TaxID=2975988 RepID=UPI002DD89A30|nr:PIN domain-containing protein [Micromonospora sp. NBC_01813]WSA06499.1 PIN domain-containing protein [Micromonospora sp. NBC_01813]